MANEVQANYEQLNSLADIFENLGEETKSVLDQVVQQMDVMKGGAWIGDNANAYYEGMEQELIPGTTRLVAAMARAAEATREVARTFEQAEEEASSVFPI